MSLYDKLDMLAFLIQDIVLVIIIYFTATRLLRSRNRFFPAFYIFALISFLLSGLYWAAYTILKADAGRMPRDQERCSPKGIFPALYEKAEIHGEKIKHCFF